MPYRLEGCWNDTLSFNPGRYKLQVGFILANKLQTPRAGSMDMSAAFPMARPTNSSGRKLIANSDTYIIP